ncbi:MAG: tRNA-binding protein [Bacteroidales bacterium]|nr:tRNA-binding protein [Bacteroidales bacterium]
MAVNNAFHTGGNFAVRHCHPALGTSVLTENSSGVAGDTFVGQWKKQWPEKYQKEDEWEVIVETISWDEFAKVELRVGRVMNATVFQEARKPAYVLQVDFGEEIGLKKSSAQITHLYNPEELVGKLVVAVVNFPKKQIGPLMSECLVTGFPDAHGEVVLCVPDKPVPLGTKLL